MQTHSRVIYVTATKEQGESAMNEQLTKCCGAYSTYFDDELVCKVCFENVEIGEGDGVNNEAEAS